MGSTPKHYQVQSTIKWKKQQDDEIVNQLKALINSLERSMTDKIRVLQETVSLILREQETVKRMMQTSALPSVTSSLPYQLAESSESRNLQLCFKFEDEFLTRIYTKTNIEGSIASLTVKVCDHTGKRVEVVPECLKDMKVKFLVLNGDLKDDWTEADFKNNIAYPRNDKPPLLKGNCEVSLSYGSARVCGFSFTDNSSSMRNGLFRLGAQPIDGDNFGCIVRSAVSPPFRVLEKRPRDSKKHDIPLPAHKLYNLINISKTGTAYSRAKQKDVETVLDFLQLYHTDQSELRSILGINAEKSWQETVDKAKKCNLTKELRKYIYHDDTSGDALLLNCDFTIESVTFEGQPSQPYDSSLFNEFQKNKIDELRKAAYKKRKELRQVCDQTPIQAGLEYLSSGEQRERGEHEQMRCNQSANYGDQGFQLDASNWPSFSDTVGNSGHDTTLEANLLMQE